MEPVNDKYFPPYKPTPFGARRQGNHVAAITEDGKQISVPRLPYVRAVDGAGNLVFLVISTNRDPQERDRAYESMRIQALTKSGGYLWDTPPYGLTMEQWVKERGAKVDELRAKAARKSVESGHQPTPAAVEAAKDAFAAGLKAGEKAGKKAATP